MRFKSTGTLVAGLFLSLPVAAAADIVGEGKITYLGNGWYGEGLAIRHSGPGIVGCPEVPPSLLLTRIILPSRKWLPSLLQPSLRHLTWS